MHIPVMDGIGVVLEPVELDISAISLRHYVHIGGEEACCNNQ